MKKSIVTRNVDQISVGNLITQLFIWNFNKISVFQTVTAGYTKSYHFEKLVKAVNNTAATETWRLSTCQNCQMVCRPYYWDKQHANISLLILMTDWLMTMHCSRKRCLISWVFLTVPHLFYQHETIFVGYFWKLTNTFKRYFGDVSEMSQNTHLF